MADGTMSTSPPNTSDSQEPATAEQILEVYKRMPRISTSRFGRNKDKSPLYLQAVAALRAVADKERTSDLVFAEVYAPLWEVGFARAYGLTKTTKSACLRKLFGKRCGSAGHRYASKFPDSEGFPCHPPGCDHPSLWYKDGKPYAFVYHPYGLRTDEIIELGKLCERLDLNVEIDAVSWHYPGKTISVTLTHKLSRENDRSANA
ncbi:hypothetical protein CCAX7_000570 [Capsulimonas corticalis]|uniref:Uncharacterized protein n=1 Tax=Capsulimonas corticalis TaxID=2219043 RepID=A0A402CRE0_9BACT|nr:hypothetical protein CCAX7_000570 [Capsulimonas corticalis]